MFLQNIYVENYFLKKQECNRYRKSSSEESASEWSDRHPGTGKAGYNGDDQLATDAQLDRPHSVGFQVIGTGQEGYSGDVPFDFSKYPHIGPRKRSSIQPFPHAYHDLVITCVETDL